MHGWEISGDRGAALHAHPRHIVQLQGYVEGSFRRVEKGHVSGEGRFLWESGHHHGVGFANHQAGTGKRDLARGSGTHAMEPERHIRGIAFALAYQAAGHENYSLHPFIFDANSARAVGGVGCLTGQIFELEYLSGMGSERNLPWVFAAAGTDRC